MKFKIDKPCDENWGNMQDISDGKYCEKCSKKVLDLTQKSEDEIDEIVKKSDGELCGRILSSRVSKIALSAVLVLNLTFLDAQNVSVSLPLLSEDQRQNDGNVIVSGELLFKESKQLNCDVDIYWIHKDKYVKAVPDNNGKFMISIPSQYINDQNLLYFSFERINKEIQYKNKKKDDTRLMPPPYSDEYFIFSKNEEIRNRQFSFNNYLTIRTGGLLRRKMYYYFNGNPITEDKFDLLRKSNPEYSYFYLQDEFAKTVFGNENIDSLYLLFSN
ncbi:MULTISPECIES: hypothetical protein [Chryseobacterium]|uniref:Uncharacterized protein n=1 Tax=Chryseobacterium taihuense TaxID=1141221 RepID=A0A4U8WAW7_9FLAO|nr:MULTISPECIES: hypothetical protein [Chryseobacterium]QQV03222.1 hypothetical protein I6I61_02350 [Chryseobacterium sp. FDAARGOS 1104]VFB03471.1 Uncharacterised protein [Chryseobacterium taihuense]